MKNIERLHYITQHGVAERDHVALAKLACEGGAKWVSLRVKKITYSEWKTTAFALKDICDQHGAQLIINDNPLLAKEVDAAGCHLGRDDMPIDQARSILGDDKIIGLTANSLDDIRWAEQLGADYIGLGPVHFTRSRDQLKPVLGIAGLLHLLKSCAIDGITLPIIATGGISLDDMSILPVLKIHGVAVSSAINFAPDPQQTAAHFVESLTQLV